MWLVINMFLNFPPHKGEIKLNLSRKDLSVKNTGYN